MQFEEAMYALYGAFYIFNIKVEKETIMNIFMFYMFSPLVCALMTSQTFNMQIANVHSIEFNSITNPAIYDL